MGTSPRQRLAEPHVRVGVVVVRGHRRVPGRAVEGGRGGQTRVGVEYHGVRAEVGGDALKMREQESADASALHGRAQPQVLDLGAFGVEQAHPAAADRSAAVTGEHKRPARAHELCRIGGGASVESRRRKRRLAKVEVLRQQRHRIRVGRARLDELGHGLRLPVVARVGTMSTRVAIVGSSGRMGRLVAGVIEASPEFEVIAGLGSADSLEAMAGADLVVDVTVPGVSQTVVETAVGLGINVLVGTSGWTADRIAGVERMLGDEPQSGVVFIPNFSLGSVIATAFAAQAARFFDSIEIVETHHAGKVDSPSGTAVRTAELMGAARTDIGPVAAPHVDQRARGQQVSSIPIHSLRMNGVLARQDVHFGGTGETLTISHETLSASSYEAGILVGLRAAREARGVTVGLDRLIDLGLA